MAKINDVRNFPYSADMMYALVSDVERYPEFLPYCKGMVIQSDQSRAGKRIRVAEMHVGYKMISERFTSRVLENPQARNISTSLVSGPFSHLENLWTFLPKEDGGCTVEFDLHYAFSSKMLERVVGVAFDRFFNLFADAFEARAHALYGSGSQLSI